MTSLRRLFISPSDLRAYYARLRQGRQTGVSLPGKPASLSVALSHVPRAAAGRIAEDLYYVAGIEPVHAAQAIDLRRRSEPGLALGSRTGALFAAFRREVPFLDRDRPLTPDIAAAARFLRSVSP